MLLCGLIAGCFVVLLFPWLRYDLVVCLVRFDLDCWFGVMVVLLLVELAFITALVGFGFALLVFCYVVLFGWFGCGCGFG